MTVLVLPDRSVDTTLRWVVRARGHSRLSPRGARVLARLADTPGQVVPLPELAESGDTPRTLSGVVRRLRVALEVEPGHPRHLHTVFGQGYRLDLPPDPTCTVPQRYDAFVGRAELLEALLESPARLLTLQGPGGMGKTRLASRLARLLRPRSPGGVFFIDLSPCRHAADIRAAVVQGLPAVTKPPANDPRQLLEAIGRSAVVLDNAEQVHEALAELLQFWLPRVPEIRWTVTSRRALGLDAEHVAHLPPLSAANAVELFAKRSGYPAHTISTLAEKLDGHPLSIELVAARTRWIPPAVFERHIAEADHAVGLPRTGVPPHQRTLEASLQWSWSLCSAEEQRVLAGITVFADTMSYDNLDGVLGVLAAETARELVRWSLLQSEGPDRVRILGMVRRFAAQHLSAPLRADLEVRHIEHFAQVPPSAEGRDNLALAIRRVPEHPVAQPTLDALAHTLIATIHRHGPPALGLDLAGVLLDQVHDHPTRARLLTAAIGWHLNLGEPEAAARTLALLTASSPGRQRLEGDIAHARGQLDSALQAYRRAYSTAASPTERAHAGLSLAETLEDTGDLDASHAIRAELGPLWPTLHNPALRIRAALSDGYHAATRGALDAAESHLQLAHTLLSDTGDGPGAALVLARRADLAVRAGDLRRAIHLGRAAVDAYEALGHRDSAATQLGNLARIYRQQGNLDQATKVAERALHHHRSTGNARAAAIVLGNLAGIDLTAGRFQSARDRYHAAIAQAESVGDARHAAISQLSEGLVLARLGAREAAVATWSTAIATHERLGDAVHAAIGRGNLGEYLLDQGDLHAATPHLERAVRVLRGCSHPAAAAFMGPLAEARTRLDPNAPDDTSWPEARQMLAQLPFELGRLMCREAMVYLLRGQTDTARRVHHEARALAASAPAHAPVSQQLRALTAHLAALPPAPRPPTPPSRVDE